MTSQKPEVLVNLRSSLGEGPLWDHRSGQLAWVDILSGLVHVTNPDTGATTSTPIGMPVGALALYGDHDYLLAIRNGFGVLTGEGLSVVAEVFDQTDKRMNDGAVDPAGRFLAGTMADGARPGGGDLYVFDVDRSNRILIESVTVSNGLAWSADGTRMFYVDSATQAIDVMDYDVNSGTIADRRHWVVIPEEDGIPDGITIDHEDCVWVALWGGAKVRRYSPEGDMVTEIRFPATQTSSCAFGGRDLDRLFVTSAAVGRPRNDATAALDGALFVVDPGCRGRREPVVPRLPQ